MELEKLGALTEDEMWGRYERGCSSGGNIFRERGEEMLSEPCLVVSSFSTGVRVGDSEGFGQQYYFG